MQEKCLGGLALGFQRGGRDDDESLMGGGGPGTTCLEF